MTRTFYTGAIAATLAAFAVVAPAQEAPLVPATLAGFKFVGVEAAPRQLLPATGRVLLGTGDYRVDNPLTVRGAQGLILYGAGRMRTRLVGLHPGLPLLRVAGGAPVIISGVSLVASDGTSQALIETVNTRPLRLLIQDAFFQGGSLKIGGPGDVVVQGTHFEGGPGPLTPSVGIEIDDADATVTVIGGNMSHHAPAHVLQHRGRLQMYATGLQGLDDPAGADVILSSGSPRGPHVLAALRSEGTNAREASTFLRVRTAPEAVDVALKANSFTSPTFLPPDARTCGSAVAPNTFVDYGAAGTVWLIGNIGGRNVTRLIRATDPAATVVALGNAVKGCVGEQPERDVFEVSGGVRLVAIDNLFDHANALGKGAASAPLRRFLASMHSLPDAAGLPLVPDSPDSAGLPISPRPTITAAPPAPFLVDATRYRRDPACRRAADDTCFLQRALDAQGAHLFIPAGLYRTSAPLRLAQAADQIGGLIAGSGSARTRIACSCATAFASDGMAYVTIQGITFQSLGAASSRDATVSLEWPEEIDGRRNPSFPTQGNNFYDARFVGGHYGLAIGAHSLRQCSENLVVDSQFADNFVGVAIGAANALSNTLAGASFARTDWNIGFSDSASGGSWVVLGASATGTRAGVLYHPALTPALYHLGFDSDGPRLLDIGWNSNETSIVFEHSRLVGGSPRNPYINFNAGQGLTFLRSTLGAGAWRLDGTGSASFIHLMYSTALPGEADVPAACVAELGTAAARGSCLARVAWFNEPRSLRP
ncbi:MAG TPA: hypothetical protein VLX08_10590 [Steroidobacteraceae bacterium]|nr:hypothetical protein [Steroidobacteraceae bacterium]